MTNLLTNLTSPADEFFHGGVLQISNGLHEIGSLKWQLVLALFVAWIVVFGVIVKGEGLWCGGCGVVVVVWWLWCGECDVASVMWRV